MLQSIAANFAAPFTRHMTKVYQPKSLMPKSFRSVSARPAHCLDQTYINVTPSTVIKTPMRYCWTTSKQAGKVDASKKPRPPNHNTPFPGQINGNVNETSVKSDSDVETSTKSSESGENANQTREQTQSSGGPHYEHISPNNQPTPPPKRSVFRKLLKYGLGLAVLVALWDLYKLVDDNPSFWYKSHTKAPYIITDRGRKVAYSEYGNKLGKVTVLVFHDYLSGRLELETLGLISNYSGDALTTCHPTPNSSNSSATPTPSGSTATAPTKSDSKLISTANNPVSDDSSNSSASVASKIENVTGSQSATTIEKLKKDYPHLRIIVVDRPGYGQSDATRQRRLSDFPEDVLALVNALKIPKFSIIGIGAGGMYALGCAQYFSHLEPGRLLKVALLSSEAPRTNQFGSVIPTTPSDQARESFIQSKVLRVGGGNTLLVDSRFKFANIWLYSFNEPSLLFSCLYGSEVKILEARKELYQKMVEGTREACAQGFHIIKDEIIAIKDRSNWLPFSDIKLPNSYSVHMWHGDKDELVPLPIIQDLKTRVPGSVLHISHGQGHLSNTLSNWKSALDYVIDSNMFFDETGSTAAE